MISDNTILRYYIKGWVVVKWHEIGQEYKDAIMETFDYNIFALSCRCYLFKKAILKAIRPLSIYLGVIHEKRVRNV